MGSFSAGFTDDEVVDAADLNTIAGAWDSFTVTFTNLTLGNGTATGFYKKIGRVICYRVQVTFGSTTSVSGGIVIALPETAASIVGVHTGIMFDDSAGSTVQLFSAPTTTGVSLRAMNTAGTYGTLAATSSTVPFTWAVNDIIRLSGVYEAA